MDRGVTKFRKEALGHCNASVYRWYVVDRLHKDYKVYARAFIDNIIVFSGILEDYKLYLYISFSLFNELSILISLKKLFTSYLEVDILGF